MCHKILKSCCIGLVEFIHKDYNTLNIVGINLMQVIDIVMIFLLVSK